MPNGLQVWDASGRLIVDTSARVGTFVGTVNSGTSSGSTWTDTAKGTPWAYATPVEEPQLGHLLPDIWFEGNTLVWEFGNVQWTTNKPVIITYGFR